MRLFIDLKTIIAVTSCIKSWRFGRGSARKHFRCFSDAMMPSKIRK